MADLSAMRRSPLEFLAKATQTCAAAELALVPPATRLVLRCRPDATIAVGPSFGVALPDACRAAVAGTRAALWLGPDEWLLLAAANEAPAITEQVSRSLAQVSHSLVDVSHRSTALTVTGAQASVLINHGCPLDLSPATFPVGMCTRTLFGKAGIILWHTAEAYRLEIERSFAAYVWQMLVEARRELITP